MNRFCLYIHKKAEDNEPFYVGIGTYDRPFRKDGRSDYWYKYVKKHDYYVEILEKNLSWEDACSKEISLIKKIGRVKSNDGPLINLTEGGEGFRSKHSDETKKILSKKGLGRAPWNKGLTKHTNESLKSASEKNSGKTPWNKGCVGCQEYKPETLKKISDAVKGFKHTKEAIEKIRKSSLNRKHSEKSKLKMSENLKKPVKQILDGNIIKIWSSIKDAEKTLNLGNISNVCLGKRKKSGGFFWEFVGNNNKK
jgi:hypothetical protein